METNRLRSLWFCIASLLLSWVWCPASRAQQAETTGIVRLQADLRKQFDQYMERPAEYAARVRRECAAFPEGDLFPYVLPALAYAHLAASDAGAAPAAREHMARLIELARPAVARRVRPPNGRLEDMTDYAGHATYLGQYGMALGFYRLIGGDNRYDSARRRINEALDRALVQAKGQPLRSYPTLTWTFDTIPALVSLHAEDLIDGGNRTGPLLQAHVKWLRDRATDRQLNLPFSRIDERTGRSLAPPRGCDLSLRISLLAQIDAGEAKRLYAEYVRSFWSDQGLVRGFREWPPGHNAPGDVDSGPILAGIGMSASGLGISAARAGGDDQRAEMLAVQVLGFQQAMAQLSQLSAAMKPAQKQPPKATSPYVTGFLFGDAALFYSVTWRGWKKIATQPAQD